jgi:cytochrome c553
MIMRKTIRRDAMVVGAALLALAAGGFLFAWSGIYNIAASKGHWAIVEWMLRFGMSNSVELRAAMIKAPDLRSDGLVTVGGNHYRSGCAYCHGAPGVKASPVSQSSLPPPPDLSNVSNRWNDSELFWIVKNGIKYTGMPAWTSQNRDDEVWAVVAFLKAMKTMSPDAYRALQPEPRASSPPAEREAIASCDGCHGVPGHGPRADLVPVLSGQKRDYLIAALEDYASGRRKSGIMQPIANDLVPAAIGTLAAHYADRLPPEPSQRVPDGDLEAGGKLATVGKPEAGVPGCNTCHAAGALPSYPRLAGQSAAYLAAQLRLWRAGVRGNERQSAVMAPIAQRLSDEQIDAVSRFYASSTPLQAAE